MSRIDGLQEEQDSWMFGVPEESELHTLGNVQLHIKE
jgi:hypothetical protein